MRTLGIDLASQPKETAVCLIEWSKGRGEVVELDHVPLTDDVLVDLMADEDVSKVGIDAPFGWPVAFIDTIATFRDHGAWLDLEPNEIRFRATDTAIWRETGQTPLSVAMSDLAWPAMRCARLLSRISPGEGVIDRTGAGRLVEVYPMAALRRWRVIQPESGPSEWSYKGHGPGRREHREQHLSKLIELFEGTVEIPDRVAERCLADDDDFDALISALVARAAEVGATDPIPRGLRWLALREGWIHLPVVESLATLAA